MSLMTGTSTALIIAVWLLTPLSDARAQVPADSVQIETAVLPAPEAMRSGARVLGYNDKGAMITLRQGSNDFVCIADDPDDNRFHVACYHNSLEAFMARGRELRAAGRSRDERNETRLREISDGTLHMPAGPASLYSLSGDSTSFDPASGTVSNVRPLYVVYLPYVTAESTGLPTRPDGDRPWIMDEGKPWAHIMIIPSRTSDQ